MIIKSSAKSTDLQSQIEEWGGVDGEEQEISSFLRMTMTRRRRWRWRGGDEVEKALSTTAKASPKENLKQMSMNMPRTTNSTTLTIPTTETQLLRSTAVTTTKVPHPAHLIGHPHPESRDQTDNVLPPVHQPPTPILVAHLLLRIWHDYLMQLSPH